MSQHVIRSHGQTTLVSNEQGPMGPVGPRGLSGEVSIGDLPVVITDPQAGQWLQINATGDSWANENVIDGGNF
ncbi:hypothetical protein FHS85_001953 [Rhodoligotrophos appendicifer]|uniref:hypothetical protein n=1 Tax=Rhodoligotrophos appendicifer TaxID=987056 RepID=UPI0011870729|nr:hypothetical protein [Rhodoligotrophos appendicifer]